MHKSIPTFLTRAPETSTWLTGYHHAMRSTGTRGTETAIREVREVTTKRKKGLSQPAMVLLNTAAFDGELWAPA